MTIPLSNKDDVYRFIWSEIKKLNCELIRIGGIQNHIHLLINLHPAVSLSQLMQNIKARTSVWMKTDNRFRHFKGWASEYYACTISPEHKSSVIEYIKGQEQHHLGRTFDSEIAAMHQYAGLPYHNLDLQ